MQINIKTRRITLSFIILISFIVTGCDNKAASLSPQELITELAGPDKNNNGVRDDVDDWINQQTLTDVQKKALTQKARAIQNTLLIDVTDKQALHHSQQLILRAVNCSSDEFDLAGDDRNYDFSKKIERLVVNTRLRATQYAKYNQACSGSTARLPDGDTCDD